MKRLLILLSTLVCVLAATFVSLQVLASSSFPELSQLESVTLTPADSNLQQAVLTDEAGLSQLYQTVSSARSARSLKSYTIHLFDLDWIQTDGTMLNTSVYASQADRSRLCVRTGEGEDFLTNLSDWRTLLDSGLFSECYQNVSEPGLSVKTDAGSFAVSPASLDWTYIDLLGGSVPVTLEPADQFESDTVLLTDPASIKLLFSPQAGQVTARLYDGEELVFSGPAEELAAQSPETGRYQLVVSAVWDQPDSFEGQAEYRCEIVYGTTEPSVTLARSTVTPGEFLVFYVQNAGDLALSIDSDFTFVPQFFPLEEGSSTKASLFPIYYDTTPGVYTFNVHLGDETVPVEVTVEPKDFPVQYLTADQSTLDSTVNSQAANLEWDQKIEPLKLISDPQLYFTEAFLQPASGPITTEFGMMRYINGSPSGSRHGGIDIAASRGTPVAAANNGRVLFADYIDLTGYTVIIEHGFGLKSWYYHMDGLNVQAGQMVERGDQIGIVGSTGFSTGPHLHFAMSVNKVFVNPWPCFESNQVPLSSES